MRPLIHVVLAASIGGSAHAGTPGLHVSPLVPGGPVTFEVASAPSGARVYVVTGSSLSPRATCPPALNGTCLDVADAQVVGSVLVRPNGVAALTVNVPASLSGSVIPFQALAIRAGVVLGITAPVSVEALDPNSDLDRDGLSALDEVNAGADPFAPDTDGGGIADGQEVLLDGTDPTDGGDDIPGERLCDNDIDDDLDTRFDCGDSSCATSCPELDCTNGVDDDGDGATDCADTTCMPLYGCGGETSCVDGRDDDRNGLVDCEDLACLDDPACMEANCQDGVDDDGDGLVDCADEDCWTPECHRSTLAWTTGLQNVDVDATLPLDALVTGSVFTSTAQGGNVCQFSVHGVHLRRRPGRPISFSEPERGVVNVDPACRLLRGFLPDEVEIETYGIPAPWGYTDTAINWLADGVFWYGRGISRYDDGEFGFLPSEAFGTCGVGTPTSVLLDRDLDGFGESGDLTVTGMVSRSGFACRPWPGVTLTPGDCDDSDPTWTPSAYDALPTCRDVGPDDRDGDGVPAAVDQDDTNRGVQ